MGKKVAKVASGHNPDPVTRTLRKQGGAAGTLGNIMNPGAAVSDKVASGAPLTTSTLLDPNGWAAPKKPKVDTSAQDAIAAQQRIDAAELDSEENRRRKRLLSAAMGVRAFTGSPLFRAAPANTAGRAAAAAAAVGGASAAGPGGSGYTGAGTRGGSRARSLIP